MHCGPHTNGWGPTSQASGRAYGAALLGRLNASGVEALRAMPAQLLQWDNTTLWSDNFAGYSVDGGVLTTMPAAAYASGATVAR